MKNISPDNTEDLLTYFDQNYVNGTERIGRNKRNRNRIPPKFPPHLWNVREATINGDPRTNNVCESWNYRYGTLVGHRHPHIWKAIKFIKMEEACVATKLQQFSVGTLP